MELNLNHKIARNQNVAYTPIDDELVLMGPEDNLFYGVNAVGTEIWTLLEFNSLTLDAVCKKIEENYEVESAQCIADVTLYVQTMIEHNMLCITE